jgi:hypothetical protein
MNLLMSNCKSKECQTKHKHYSDRSASTEKRGALAKKIVQKLTFVQIEYVVNAEGH